MDPAAHPPVLLEAMALAAHEDQESAGLGREPENSDPAWCQQQQDEPSQDSSPSGVRETWSQFSNWECVFSLNHEHSVRISHISWISCSNSDYCGAIQHLFSKKNENEV